MFIPVRKAASELSEAEYAEIRARQRVKEAKEQLLKTHLKIEAVQMLELLGVAPDVMTITQSRIAQLNVDVIYQ